MEEKIKAFFGKIYKLSPAQRMIAITAGVLLLVGGAVFAVNKSEPIKTRLKEVVSNLTERDLASEEEISPELKEEIENTRSFVLPDQNLIARWPFDEPKGDIAHAEYGSCGNSCNGELVNFPNLKKQDAAENSGWTFEKRFLGKGSLMLEKDNFVKVSDTEKLDIPSSVTLEIWVKIRDIKDWARIISWRHGSDNVQLGFYGNEKKVVAQVKRTEKEDEEEEIGEETEENPQENSGRTLITKKVVYPFETGRDAWTHISVIEKDDDLEIYFDGALQDTGDGEELKEPEEEGISIGPLDGIIDSLGIYDQSLSTEKIQDYYSAAVNYYAASKPNSSGQSGGAGDTGGGEISDHISSGGKIALGSRDKGDDAFVSTAGAMKDENMFRVSYAGFDGDNWRIYNTTSFNGRVLNKTDNSIPPVSNNRSSGGRIPLGELGKPDDTFVASPNIIKGSYRQYCGEFDGDNWRISEATSSDSYNWDKKGVVLEPGEQGDQDDTFVTDPFVLQEKIVACDGSEEGIPLYHMWYSGFDGDNWRIFHAISTDGSSWEKTGVAIDLGEQGEKDDTFVKRASVVLDIEKQRVQYCCVEVNRTYHMYYGGFDGDNWRIFHAISMDGTNWIKVGVVVDLGNEAGLNGMGDALGGLGLNLEGSSENAGDDTYVYNPSAVLVKRYSDCKTVEKKFHLWYTGFDGDNERVFKAESNDGFTFYKVNNQVGGK